MSSPSKITLSNLTPDLLRTIVLDYLCHGCYTRTAAAFSRESNPVKKLDADGDEIPSGSKIDGSSLMIGGADAMIEQIKLRQEIRVQILSGRIDEAIDLLNKHFPAVLAEDHLPAVLAKNHPTGESHKVSSTTAPTPIRIRADGGESRPIINDLEYLSSTSTEPAHLLLNLRILAFCEACRTIPLNYPPRPSSSSDVADDADADAIDVDVDGEDSDAQQEQQLALLLKAQKLYAYKNTLPSLDDRETYQKELGNVSGLLAYKIPEKSSMAKYLSMERREAVADQINKAILKRTGQPVISALELIARYTSVVWGSANELGVKAKPGAIVPPKLTSNSDMEVDSESVPSFSIPRYLGSQP